MPPIVRRAVRAERHTAARSVIPNAVRRATTRQAVLTAAAEAFNEHGYLATRLNDIVGRTSLTKGAVYFHFASKDDLAAALIDEHQSRIDEIVAEIRAGDDDPLDQLIAFTREVTLSYRDEPIVRAGSRLAIERALQDPAGQSPLQWWTEILARYARGASRAGITTMSGRALARTVAAFFLATHHLSCDVDGREAVRRIDQFWAELVPTIRR